VDLPREAEDASFAGIEADDEELEGHRFVRCSFRGASLDSIRTTNCTFEACDFSNAQLNGSEHDGSDFANSTFENTNLFGASFVECRLLGATFLGGVLTGLSITGGDLSYVLLRGQDLSGLDLTGVKLREADLSESTLKGVDLRRALPVAARDGSQFQHAHHRPPTFARRCARTRDGGCGSRGGGAPDSVSRLSTESSQRTCASRRNISASATIARFTSAGDASLTRA